MAGLINKLFSSKKKNDNQEYTVPNTSLQMNEVTDTIIEDNNMLTRAYIGFWNSLSFKQSSNEALECITDTYGYATRNKEKFSKRNVDIDSISIDDLRWIGIVDLLVENGYLFEVSPTCSLEEFIEKVNIRNQGVDMQGLDSGDSLETWIKILDYRWKQEFLGFIRFYIDSETYILYVDSFESLKYFNRDNEYLPKKVYRCVEADKIVATESMFQDVCIALGDDSLRDYVGIELLDKTSTIFESKLGGLPYLSKDNDVPTNNTGKPLCFLAQINLEELPKVSVNFPQSGMIQFWIESNELFGLDIDKSKKSYCVKYIEKIDETIKTEYVQKKYVSDIYRREFPFEGEFGMRFRKERQSFPLYLYGNESSFLRKWNEMYPESQILEVSELGDLYDDALDLSLSIGHKISGFPFFTLYDPREGTDEYDVLLLQIDSDFIAGRSIAWGDAGVANFFISKENLENRNFSDILYNWDCY
ncbi:MAG: DUF1963 domain-containing protein [Erysipelothrix sp.]